MTWHNAVRSCRYCGSPARGNPCWYFIKYPNAAQSGGDPECYEYADYYDRRAQRSRRRNHVLHWLALFLVLAATAIAIIWGTR